jgi:hypothetical protein
MEGKNRAVILNLYTPLMSTTPLQNSPLCGLHCSAEHSHMAFQIKELKELKAEG